MLLKMGLLNYECINNLFTGPSRSIFVRNTSPESYCVRSSPVAISVSNGRRPVALRPTFSGGLPFSVTINFRISNKIKYKQSQANPTLS